MNNAFDLPATCVQEFITAYEMPADLNLWTRLVVEEDIELVEAMAQDVAEDTLESLTNVLKEACDVIYVVTGLILTVQSLGLRDILDFNEAFYARLADMLLEVNSIFGGDVVTEAFKRVHASNMSKLGDDGKPIRREDGKVLKGPNYAPPVLTDLVMPIFVKTRQTLVLA